MRKILVLLLATVLLSGCATPTPAPYPSRGGTTGEVTTVPAPTETTVAVTETESAVTEDVPDPAPLPIVDDFLDFDSSSWERTENVEMVMIHFSSAVVTHYEDPYRYEYVREIFENNEIGINYFIERDGTIYRWLPEDRTAWHAKTGSYGDEKYTNAIKLYSIGIELAAMGSEDEMTKYITREAYRALDDSLKGYTEEQYASLAALLLDITSRYQIPLDRSHVIGHDEYSPQKKDPGCLFDWSRVIPEQTAE